MSDELPNGWAEITLQDVGVWRSGGTPSRRQPEFFGKGIPWVKSGDLPDGPIQQTDEEITELGLQNSSAKLMPAGTISMALYGATIGTLGMMTFPAATNQACANVIPDTRLVDSKYLFNYLLSERRNFIEQGQGGAQPNISQEIVRTHPFRLAPLGEQRRIVAKLETLLGKVDASQKRMAKIPILLKRFRQSVLAAACTGRLTADWREENPNASVSDSLRQKTTVNEGTDDFPASWIPCCIGDVMRLKNGFAFKSTDYRNEGVPLVRISNIQDGKVNLDDSAKLPPEKANLDFSVENGDLLVAMSGATTGKFGIYFGDERCLQNQRVGNIKILDANEVLPGYRNIALQSLKRRIEEDAYGGAQPNISPTKIEALPFGCPPIPEQQEIVRRVEGLFALADQLELRLAKAQAHINKLTPSLLARAFAGKLVPQDPTDEPAEKLLERIRTRTQ